MLFVWVHAYCVGACMCVWIDSRSIASVCVLCRLMGSLRKLTERFGRGSPVIALRDDFLQDFLRLALTM
jgi:hypothetical protein